MRHCNVAYWPITTCCAAVADGRFRGIADSGKPSTREIYGFTA